MPPYAYWPDPCGLGLFWPWPALLARYRPYGYAPRSRLDQNQNSLQQNVNLFLREPLLPYPPVSAIKNKKILLAGSSLKGCRNTARGNTPGQKGENKRERP